MLSYAAPFPMLFYSVLPTYFRRLSEESRFAAKTIKDDHYDHVDRSIVVDEDEV